MTTPAGTTLAGMTWDHPRGLDPLVAASAEFERDTGVRIDWAVRPLSAFEDASVPELATRYDLIAFDHPAIGDALRADALLPLDDLLGDTALSERAEDSAGASDASYRWAGSQWAVAIDAACMVASVRPDLVDVSWLPSTWAALGAFSEAVGRPSVLIAANPTHLFCTLVSLCQAVAPAAPRHPDGRPAWWTDTGLDEQVVREALEMLRGILAAVSPESLDLDPIGVYERMTDGRAVYCPLAFGYVSYALTARAEPSLLFVPPPEASRSVGTLTGGVGLGISARTSQPRLAADFLAYVTSRAIQSGTFPEAGGQPARASAWLDTAVNARSAGFFQLTYPVQARSFLRPRFAGFPAFQLAAGEELHRLIRADAEPRAITDAFRALWRRLVRP